MRSTLREAIWPVEVWGVYGVKLKVGDESYLGGGDYLIVCGTGQCYNILSIKGSHVLSWRIREHFGLQIYNPTIFNFLYLLLSVVGYGQK